MEQKERTFADGFIFKRREDAPGRTGNAYVELNTYESKKNVDSAPTQQQPKAKPAPAPQEDEDEDLPF
jgi:hypothetical protein